MLLDFVFIAALFSSASAVPATGLPKDGIQRWKVTNWDALWNAYRDDIGTSYSFEIEGDEYTGESGTNDPLVPAYKSLVPAFVGRCAFRGSKESIPDGSPWVLCDSTDKGGNSGVLESRIKPFVVHGGHTQARIQVRFKFVDARSKDTWLFTSNGTLVPFDAIFVKGNTFNVDNIDGGVKV
ncbi:hypothetical protein HYALB_00005101 [Hymenoscyphus albidus]|uniref:Uncharacterized protein n=1 Tax=Hymenoscyphus albidus TaxID=595503 RepID=A0A9N9QBI5_9HELO|nr:hypothetical protein HYALB_00005101 [Hymenoscyphus albidus]